MNEYEAAELLGHCAAFDNRKPSIAARLIHEPIDFPGDEFGLTVIHAALRMGSCARVAMPDSRWKVSACIARLGAN